MHNGDTFALNVVRYRYFRPVIENLGSPEFSELLELYQDRVNDASIASAAKTTARQRFGGALRRNDRDWDGGKIRLFAEFCIDEEGIPPLDCTEATCVRYLARIAERGTIGDASLQPYLSAINTFLRHTGPDDAPATGPAIGDMKRALQIRQLKTS
eukprot:jgi/Tetstr1/449082/TSEL_036295.t1